MLVYFRLVKAGYGSIQEVKQMTAREVIQALHYERFLDDYESSFMAVNQS